MTTEAEIGVMGLDSHRMLRIVSKHLKVEERERMIFPSEPSDGTNPADVLILDFWPPELRQTRFSYF